nr:reverse transcriptase domain-containing protein [Tanacetum cinerariifolium]
MYQGCLRIIESKSKVRNSRNKPVVAKVSTSTSTPEISSDVVELKDMVKALLLDKKNQSQAPAPVKAVEESCVTCGGSGTLPSNTVTNPKEDLKGITTRSGVAYQGPTIPTTSSTPKVVEFVDFDADPRVPLILERSFLKTGRALINVYEGELTLRVGNKAITFNLDQTSRYSANYNDLMANRIDVIEMAYEEYYQKVLSFSDVIASGNPTSYYDPIVFAFSLTLTSFGDSDFLLEEVDAFLALEDEPTSPKVDHSYHDSEGDILLLEAFLNDDPSLPPPTQGIACKLVRQGLRHRHQLQEDVLLRAPTEGYEDAIVVPEITAANFEIKHGLLTLVQNKQFFGHDKKDPHAHIRYFNKFTSTLKYPNVLSTSVKLMLFSFSLKGTARIWLEKEPPRLILTWDDLVSKFINKFFPPSKTTNLRNEITRFQQRIDETFYEVWDRFNDLLQACPHHGVSELHQLDTFYNALNSNDQDSLNSDAGVSTSTSTPEISSDVVELKDMVKALLLDKKNQSHAPAPVKAVEESCVTCGGTHSYQNFPATDGNIYRNNIQEYISQAAAARFNQGNTATDGNIYRNNIQEYVSQASAVNYNKGNTSYHPQMMSNQIRPPGFPSAPAYQAPAPQTQGVSKEDFSAYVKANDAVMKNMQTQGQNIQNQLTNLTDLITKFVNSNVASTSSSGTLPSNTIANPKMNPTNDENTKDVQPQAVQSKSPVSISESEIAPVSASKPNPKALIPYPSRRNDERNREKANNKTKKFYKIFKDMSFEISFVDALILMPKFTSTLKALIGNNEKLSEMARIPLNKHCFAVLLKKLPEKLGDTGKFLIPCDFPGMAECLALADLSASIDLMPFYVWKRLSLSDLTPKCMTLELADRSISRPVGVAEDVYVKVGSFHFPADFVVMDFDADPRVLLILRRSFLKTKRALIDVFEGMVECLALANLDASINLMSFSVWKSLSLSDLTPTYMTLELADRLISRPVGVAEDVYIKVEDHSLRPEDLSLIYSKEVLGFSDTISSGNPTSYYDPIVFATSPTLTPFENSDFLLEEVDAFLAIEDEPTSSEFHQSYLNLERGILLLEAFLNDDPSLPPPNQRNYMPEVCKEPKIREAKSDKSSVDEPLMVELKVLPPHLEYAFSECDDKLQVIIAKDLSVEKNTALLTVLKLNEATRKDHFPLSFMDNMLERLAGNQYYCFLDGFSGYFQIPMNPKDQEKTTFTCPYRIFAYRCMHFGLCNASDTFQRNSFQSCLSHLERMLKRCEDTNLCLPWEKSHFMVKEGIVLCHKISKLGIKVDKAKVDVISKLPHPTTVNGIRSFLGHTVFYRRFINDFSKIARPMTRLLEKDTPFIFSHEYVDAFQTLKRKLTKAPILIALDWDMPFELMCDASDFAIRAEFTFKVVDTKGAENLAANHLSRLENPHQNVLNPKEINESFPFETLNLVSTRGNQSTPWFADFANYHAGNFIVKEGVYPIRKPLISSRLATLDQQEVTVKDNKEKDKIRAKLDKINCKREARKSPDSSPTKSKPGPSIPILVSVGCQKPGHLAAWLGCAETKVATWDDLAFKHITLGWNEKHENFAKMLIQS